MNHLALIGMTLCALLLGCSTTAPSGTYSGTTRISVSGTPGDVVTGFYLQDGQRCAISNAVPCSLDVPRLSSLLIHAPDSGREAVVELNYDAPGIGAKAKQVLGSGINGVRARVANSFIIRPF